MISCADVYLIHNDTVLTLVQKFECFINDDSGLDVKVWRLDGEKFDEGKLELLEPTYYTLDNVKVTNGRTEFHLIERGEGH